MRTPTLRLLNAAQKNRTAVPTFNVWNLETVLAVFRAAAAQQSPIILETSESAIKYSSLFILASMIHAVGKEFKVPYSLHLDHARDLSVIRRVIKSGLYDSVMYDGSHLSFAENIKNTITVRKLTSAARISLEAELGAIPGKEDDIDFSEQEASLTRPSDAAEFVDKTRCDFLAIAVGTAHGPRKYEHTPTLDLNRISDIARAVSVPLVLHGASSLPEWLLRRYEKNNAIYHDGKRLEDAVGVPEALIRKAVSLGICKVNVDTDLRVAFLTSLRDELLNSEHGVDIRSVFSPAIDFMQKMAEEKIMSMR